jgi:S-formylglutathione hydrolase FrmB
VPLHRFSRPRGRIVELAVESPALQNRLGDPTTRTVAVYLPPGYDDGDERYPLMVDLAAFTGSGLRRLAWTAFGESVPQRVDRLIDEGRMGPVVLAFPDAFTSLGGNQYVDSPVTGGWERFIADELVPALERHVRLLPGRDHRAVYGKSSGGYGALMQAFRHADRWAAVACHSGDMGFDLVYRRDLPAALDGLGRHGGIGGYLAHVRQAPALRGDDFHLLMILAMAASYDPDPDPAAPDLGLRLPVDPHTCALVPERWAAWLAHDPVQLVQDDKARESLARLRLLFFDCGRRDQYFLHYGARSLAQALAHHGVPHVHEEFDGTHSNIDHRLDVSLPRLYEVIAGG